jgi:NAD(P)-dependent dehydrogenase (short-subunit alcohol dehydrogenase family)
MLENRVCVITGAANGIGREHALLFASLGARLVVNDLGGAIDGSGSNETAAQVVANEINAAGGEAVASTESVSSYEGAAAIVSTAVEAFGDLHVVVNNAGILRDRMLVSMTEQDFDDVVAVHMKGTFNVTKHAADYWRERSKAGDFGPRNIVNTSSGTGLHGNPGQTNYAAAKGGIAAMTMVNAMELKRYGVRANCIAPIARTRLTLQTPGLNETMGSPMFDPSNISPLVAVLASADCPFNGQVFSSYGGVVGMYGGWHIAHEVIADGGALEGRWSTADLAEALHDLPQEVDVLTQVKALERLQISG